MKLPRLALPKDPKLLAGLGVGGVAAYALWRRQAAAKSASSSNGLSSGTTGAVTPLDAASITSNLLDVLGPQIDTLNGAVLKLEAGNPAPKPPTSTVGHPKPHPKPPPAKHVPVPPAPIVLTPLQLQYIRGVWASTHPEANAPVVRHIAPVAKPSPLSPQALKWIRGATAGKR